MMLVIHYHIAVILEKCLYCPEALETINLSIKSYFMVMCIFPVSSKRVFLDLVNICQLRKPKLMINR